MSENGEGPRPPAKPLWGFGPAGVVLLVVATALAVVLITGYDLRFEVQRLILALFGVDAMLWFTSVFLTFHRMDFCSPPPSPRFGLATMGAVLIGFQVAPQRIRWWWYVATVVLGLFVPPLVAMSRVWIVRLTSPGAMDDTIITAVSMFVWTALAALVVWAATRSWRTGLALALLGALGAWHTAEVHRWASGSQPLLFNVCELFFGREVWLWNPAVLGVMLVWAVAARRRWSRAPWECSKCRFDLRGISAAVCPECGTPKSN